MAAWLRQRPFDALALGLLVVALVVVGLTFRDYGVAWDEQGEQVEGELLLQYYASGLRDRSAFEFVNFRFYGGGFELPAALLARALPFGPYDTRHLLSALIGVIGLAVTWRLARALGGPRVGALAALLLAANPSWYGHTFINARDVPFAAGMTACLLLSLRMLGELPRLRLRTSLVFGLALGLTLGVRIGGVLALGYLLVMVALWMFRRAGEGARSTELARDAGRTFGRLLPGLGVAYGVMALLWPWAIEAPLNPWRALTMFSRFPYDGLVLFAGRLFPARALPASYLPTLLALTQPEVLLVGVAVAAWLGAAAAARRPRVLLDDDGMRVIGVALAAVFPVLYFVIARPVAYNGMRHFLFVLPPLSVLAALALDRLFELARRREVRVVLGVALAAAGALQARALFTLHPDEYVYFNALVGGPRGAQRRYELDYWGTSLAEATRRMAQDLERRGELPRAGQPPFKVYVCGNVWSAEVFFPPGLAPADSTDDADFMVSIAQFYCQPPPGSRRVLGVRRAGALLSFVDDLRPRRAANLLSGS